MQFLRVLTKWRRFLYVNVLIVLVAGVVLSFLLRPLYDSQAVIVPITEQTPYSQLGAQIPLNLLFGFGAITSPSDLFVEVLNSRRLREGVIEKLNLIEFFKAPNIEEALVTLSKVVKVSSGITGVVSIKARTRDPKMSAKIVNSMIASLDSFNKYSVMYRGKRIRIMLEKRLAELEEQMKAAEDSLAAFQERNKTFSLPDEWKVVMEQYAGIKEREMESSIRLNILEEIASPEHPEVLKTKRNLQGIRKELEKFEKYGQVGFGPGFSVPLEKMAEVSMELARRMRDVEVYNEVYAFLVQQLEQARILEKKDTPTLQVVDLAVPSMRKAWPMKSMVLGGSLVIGVILGLLFVFLLEFREEIERNPRFKNFKSLLDSIAGDLHLK